MVKEQRAREHVTFRHGRCSGEDAAWVRASAAGTQEKVKNAADASEDVGAFFDRELPNLNSNIFWNLFVVNLHLAVTISTLFLKKRVWEEEG